MSDIVVIGLDAADYRLLNDWGCENLLLNSHGKLETEAWSRKHPYTLDIWPTIATGEHPTDHKIGEHGHDVEWDNRFLSASQKLADTFLPQQLQDYIGALFVDNSNQSHQYNFPICESDHVFDEVYSWPGADDAVHLAEAWEIWHEVEKGSITEDEVEKRLMGLARDELSWAASSEGMVGTHIHTLDVVGHLYCKQPEKLREWYERVDRLANSYLSDVDEVVILSDHGMQVSWYDDKTPGDHSWQAFIATSINTDLPEHVLDVHSWLRGLKKEHDETNDTSTTVESDTNMDQLRDLGYI